MTREADPLGGRTPEPPDDLARATYARMRWNTPLSVEHAELLLERLDVAGAADVLDIGCGWGELLLRAVAAGGDATTGTGVDTDDEGLDRGRARAAELGLAERVTFVNAEASSWRDRADRVLCVGASHALGGTQAALAELAGLVRPGGRLLYGDACWERPPTEAAAAIFGDEAVALDAVVGHAAAAGWRVLHLSTADQREWDDFESTYRAGHQEWLLAHPDDERASAVRDRLDAQQAEYLMSYRGVLGLCYLVLAREGDERPEA